MTAGPIGTGAGTATGSGAGTGAGTAMAIDPGLAGVPARTLLTTAVEACCAFPPGDATLVAEGQRVELEPPIAERLRDPRTEVVAGPADSDELGVPGARWSPAPGRRGRETEADRPGELLFRSGGRWRI